LLTVDWSPTWYGASALSWTDWDKVHHQKTTIQTSFCFLFYMHHSCYGEQQQQSTMASNLRLSWQSFPDFLAWSVSVWHSAPMLNHR
jgi:hypothetical protein